MLQLVLLGATVQHQGPAGEAGSGQVVTYTGRRRLCNNGFSCVCRLWSSQGVGLCGL